MSVNATKQYGTLTSISVPFMLLVTGIVSLLSTFYATSHRYCICVLSTLYATSQRYCVSVSMYPLCY